MHAHNEHTTASESYVEFTILVESSPNALVCIRNPNNNSKTLVTFLRSLEVYHAEHDKIYY